MQPVPPARLSWLRLPPMGTMILVIAHLAFVLALEYINNDVAGARFWQARGVRAGWLAVAQIPLLIILAGKYNIISLLSGVSYERLNVLHRWTSRITLLLAILHFGYQSYGWQKYGVMSLEWAVDECTTTGIAAFVLLLWINLSNLPIFRLFSYEVFVIQHLISFFGFIIAIMYHLPTTALQSRVYIYIPIGLWFVDRCIQGVVYGYRSLHSTATITALEGNATYIRLSGKTMKHWSPGSFMLLSIPRFGLMQSHPATIVSTPTSHAGDLVFILKSQRGFTKRLLAGAGDRLISHQQQDKRDEKSKHNMPVVKHRAFMHGPYGGSQSDFGAFDSICLIAGSTGITFTLSLLQNLSDRLAAGSRLPLRRIQLIWCVQSSSWTRWCKDELSSAWRTLHDAGIDVDISIYVTCADGFTEQNDEPKACGCKCDKSLGPCCCVLVEDDEEEISERPAVPNAKSQPQEKTAAVSERSTSSSGSATRLQVLPCASFYSGRPDIPVILRNLLEHADGESAVAVCGPAAMNASVRNTVVRLSDERAIHKGSGAQGCYLHVESFS